MKLIVCRRFEPTPPSPPLPRPAPPYMAIPSFYTFSEPPAFSTILPHRKPGKHKNKLMWQSYFFILEDLKIMLHAKKQHFYKQHLAEI